MKLRNWKIIKSARKVSGNGSDIYKFDRVWHILCNKYWGWNTTHTTGSYINYKANTSALQYQLSTTNPYCYMIKEYGPNI